MCTLGSAEIFRRKIACHRIFGKASTYLWKNIVYSTFLIIMQRREYGIKLRDCCHWSHVAGIRVLIARACHLVERCKGQFSGIY